MTVPRAGAYARVKMTLQNTDLQGPQQAEIRHVADALLFCADLRTDALARSEFAHLETMLEGLVACGRCSRGRATELENAVWACGPGPDADIVAAAA